MKIITKKQPNKQIIQSHGVKVVVYRVAGLRSRYGMRLLAGGSVAARVPPRWDTSDINNMLHKHRRWLAKRAADLRAKQAAKKAQIPAGRASPLPPVWYKRAAAVALPPRVKAWAKTMRLSPSKISISAGKRQWGSCNARGEIRLSYRLLLVPVELADYVIIHELAHLAHLNHGPRFWALVARYVPDFKAKKTTLNRLGGLLD